MIMRQEQVQQAARDEKLVSTRDRGIYHKANVDYAGLIWEDLQYQIDYRQGSSYHIVDDDGILDILKFINKGEEYHVYTKPVPAKGSKATVIPKKATADSKRKRPKKKVSIHEESSDEESKEEEERLIRRRHSKCPHRIKLWIHPRSLKALSCLLLWHRAGLGSEVPDKLIGKSTDSDEGAGTSPEVSDKLKDKSEDRDDLEDWGSTDDEEYILAYKDEKPKDIPWQSTDDDEPENDDE
ncbi:hypothetical protein Tco_1200449 [Tanacetum coccineum]